MWDCSVIWSLTPEMMKCYLQKLAYSYVTYFESSTTLDFKTSICIFGIVSTTTTLAADLLDVADATGAVIMVHSSAKMDTGIASYQLLQ